MNYNNLFRSLRQTMHHRPTAGMLTAMLMMLAAAGCTDDADNDNRLPDGKYPITFSAAVDGLAVSRATTDANGETLWTEGDRIAVSLNESSDSKTYQITNASTGAMEPVTPDDMLCWKTSTEELKIQAWYPATSATNVDISDQSQGFVDFDCLKAETTAKFSATDAVALSFEHQMAKVTCTLTTDNDITDITHATVSFYGYTTASFEKGTVTAGSGSSKGWITSTSGKEAVVVPQEIKGQQFIRVTISGREYFYTSGENDPDLEAGKRYDYTIKVNETGLESVTIDTYPSWTDGSSVGGGEGTETKCHVYLPEGHGLTADNITGATQVASSSNVYEISDRNTFSISYTLTDDNALNGFLIAKGIGDCKGVVSHNTSGGRTYTFTYSNIRSDISLVYTFYPEVGYYYYADGTCSPTYNNGSSPACIGIVFKVGAGEGDNISNYAADTFTDNVIHGYVVALSDAHAGTCTWGGKGTLIGTSTNQNDFAGYSNTQKIIAKAIEGGHLKPDDGINDYPAAYYISEYDKTVQTPTNTSGWYFPSTGQLKEVYRVKDNIHTDVLTLQSDDYLSSSEYDRGYIAFNVGYVSFRDGTSEYREKDASKYVRAILTF